MDRKITSGVPLIGVAEGGSQFGCRLVLCDVAHTVTSILGLQWWREQVRVRGNVKQHTHQSTEEHTCSSSACTT